MKFDGLPHSCRELPSLKSQIKLGYTIKGCTAHPFSLRLKDFRNLVVLGERAKDVYYLFLSQLCDQLQLPIVVLKESNEDDLESLICETPIWNLDVAVSQITLNPLDLGGEPTPAYTVILANLLSEIYELSLKAKTLLQAAIWNTILTSQKPSLHELSQSLPYYREHKDAYSELCSLLEVLDKVALFSSFDNLSLSRFHFVPTIISLPKTDRGCLIATLLLLKLLARQGVALPPLILFNPPLNPLLIELLFKCYAVSGDFLLFLDSKGSFPQLDSLIPYNLVISKLQDSSPFFQQLTEDERILLQSHHNLVAVKLYDKPTQLVNIF